jgi:hypothetical protein
MPYTLLQTLNYLSATNRAYFSPDPSQNLPVVSRRSIQERSSCRLVVCRAKTKHTRRLLVFKATGPGKKVGGVRNLPCGQGGCLVCGKLLGEFRRLAVGRRCLSNRWLELELFVKDLENKCPGLIGCSPKGEDVLAGRRVLSSWDWGVTFRLLACHIRSATESWFVHTSKTTSMLRSWGSGQVQEWYHV